MKNILYAALLSWAFLSAAFAHEKHAASAHEPKAAQALVGLTLTLAVICIGAAGWISHAGGRIRHTEFREGPHAQESPGSIFP